MTKMAKLGWKSKLRYLYYVTRFRWRTGEYDWLLPHWLLPRIIWKNYYRLIKWYKYRTYYKNLPDNKVIVTGVNVRRVKDGTISRPLPIPTYVKSKYWSRVVALPPTSSESDWWALTY